MNELTQDQINKIKKVLKYIDQGKLRLEKYYAGDRVSLQWETEYFYDAYHDHIEVVDSDFTSMGKRSGTTSRFDHKPDEAMIKYILETAYEQAFLRAKSQYQQKELERINHLENEGAHRILDEILGCEPFRG